MRHLQVGRILNYEELVSSLVSGYYNFEIADMASKRGYRLGSPLGAEGASAASGACLEWDELPPLIVLRDVPIR